MLIFRSIVTYDILTNAEDVEAKSMIDRFVDQLVRHAVKANMASERYSAGTFSLKTTNDK